MRWATRSGPHVDRTACAWLIRRFVDSAATFVFVDDADEVPADATAFDMRGAELSHRDGGCSFETVLRRYELDDPALHLKPQRRVVVAEAVCRHDPARLLRVERLDRASEERAHTVRGVRRIGEHGVGRPDHRRRECHGEVGVRARHMQTFLAGGVIDEVEQAFVHVESDVSLYWYWPEATPTPLSVRMRPRARASS